ncbi:MAG TPA: UdgX family uracil-DNA binding protein [Kofleriaceae bacterium]|nr:UdgX family uracil-DNA binding protein [Kofleriaceae bacterium]
MPVARAPASIPGAEGFVPERHELPQLRAAIPACHGCTLYRHATQAVFGEGAPDARVMLIGEVPGDAEDLAGRPFVGPAGRLLDEALAAAHIARDTVYVTNAVKHFKFVRRGKRRLHERPSRHEIAACKPWLGAELDAVHPDIVVLLGATAAQALLGASFRITRARGEPLATGFARYTFATVHPASVLRAPDDDLRRAAKDEFFHDLAVVGEYLRKL